MGYFLLRGGLSPPGVRFTARTKRETPATAQSVRTEEEGRVSPPQLVSGPSQVDHNRGQQHDMAERELVPFFPEDVPSVASTPSAPPTAERPAGGKRKNKLKTSVPPRPPETADVASTPQKPGKGKKGGTRAAAKAQQKPKEVAKAPARAQPQNKGVKAAFAGSAFEQSPDPSTLPKPRFGGVGSGNRAQGSPTMTMASPAYSGSDVDDLARNMSALLGIGSGSPVSVSEVAPQIPEASLNGMGGLTEHNAATKELRSILGVKALS